MNPSSPILKIYCILPIKSCIIIFFSMIIKYHPMQIRLICCQSKEHPTIMFRFMFCIYSTPIRNYISINFNICSAPLTPIIINIKIHTPALGNYSIVRHFRIFPNIYFPSFFNSYCRCTAISNNTTSFYSQIYSTINSNLTTYFRAL